MLRTLFAVPLPLRDLLFADEDGAREEFFVIGADRFEGFVVGSDAEFFLGLLLEHALLITVFPLS